MDVNIFVGIAVALAAIYIGAPDVRQDLMVYLQLNSFIFVAGGTVGSTLISTSFKEFRNILRVLLNLVRGDRALQPHEAVKILVSISESAQKTSKQELVNLVVVHNDKFLTNAVELVAMGLEKDFVNQTLETGINENRRRHMKVMNMVRTMGAYAPMFGMAGTVIGVIQVLKNVTDIDNIVSGMALALLTTLYGLFLSSVFFIPVANKLKSRSDREGLTKEIIREGIWMIMEKEIPLKVEKYLSSFLSKKYNEKEQAQ